MTQIIAFVFILRTLCFFLIVSLEPHSVKLPHIARAQCFCVCCMRGNCLWKQRLECKITFHISAFAINGVQFFLCQYSRLTHISLVRFNLTHWVPSVKALSVSQISFNLPSCVYRLRMWNWTDWFVLNIGIY